MNVLIIGKDPTLFESCQNTHGDARKRHILYARKLRETYPGSNIKIITYTEYQRRKSVEVVEDGLILYPTNTKYRIAFLFGALKQAICALKNWKPDIVTVQTPYEEGIIGYFISILTGAKLLTQLHFDIYSTYWKKEHWSNVIRYHITSWIFRHSEGIRVVSEGLKKATVKKLGIPENKIYVVPVGVNFVSRQELDKNLYKRKIKPILEGKPIVLYVGRFSPEKNLPFWVEIAQKVSCEIENICFIMVGDGTELNNIKKLVKEKSLEDKFFFLGLVNYEKLPDIYAAADVFLLTSYYEGFGRVVIEAQMAGVPVVSTKSGGPNEIIIDQETGFLCNSKNGECLSNSIINLLKNSVVYNKLRLAGLQRTKEKYSLGSLVNSLIRCWTEVSER